MLFLVDKTAARSCNALSYSTNHCGLKGQERTAWSVSLPAFNTFVTHYEGIPNSCLTGSGGKGLSRPTGSADLAIFFARRGWLKPVALADPNSMNILDHLSTVEVPMWQTQKGTPVLSIYCWVLYLFKVKKQQGVTEVIRKTKHFSFVVFAFYPAAVGGGSCWKLRSIRKCTLARLAQKTHELFPGWGFTLRHVCFTSKSCREVQCILSKNNKRKTVQTCRMRLKA